MAEFFHVVSADQFMVKLGCFPRLSSERIALDLTLGRILSDKIIASEDLPEGPRSTVDGFAVRAEDTFGASDSIPALLNLAAAIPMGVMPDFTLNPGEAAPIPTGGFLPKGADAVVMVEYTNSAGAGAIEVSRPVTLRTNVLEKGEEALLARGWLADHASKSIDIQYFIWSTDNIGILASEALLRADPHVIARRRDPQGGLQVRAIDHLPGVGALDPEVLGGVALGRDQLAHAGGDLGKPSLPLAFRPLSLPVRASHGSIVSSSPPVARTIGTVPYFKL